MNNQPTLNEMRAAVLLDHGVPPDYANEVEAWALRGRFAKRPSRPSFRNQLRSFLILLPFIGLIGFLLYLLNEVPARQAEAVARAEGAFFLHSGVIIGPFLLLLIAGTACLGAWPLFEDPYDGRHKAAKGLWESPGLPGAYTKTIISLVRRHSESADQFLLRFRRFDLRLRTAIVTAALIGVAVVTVGETSSFHVVGPRGVTQQKFWGDATRVFYPIGDVTSVRTDCYYKSGRGGGWRIVFDLQMLGGQSFNIGSERLLRGDRLEALETVAATLPSTVSYVPEVAVRERIDSCIGAVIDNQPRARERLIRLLDPDPSPTASSG